MENNIKINIPFVNKSGNKNPKYETKGSSGFDLRANLESDTQINLAPLERAIIPTGLYFDLPDNFELQIRPRSGLAAKNGVTVLNTPGTVDSDYTGEVKVILVNLSNDYFTVRNGDRIAQAVVAPVWSENFVELSETDSINKETERNQGGFGSTGLN